jgi:hypothetical protein
VHASAPAQLTSRKTLAVVRGAGFGLGTHDQVVPFAVRNTSVRENWFGSPAKA